VPSCALIGGITGIAIAEVDVDLSRQLMSSVEVVWLLVQYLDRSWDLGGKWSQCSSDSRQRRWTCYLVR
jgi:hypothetical protein